MAVCPAVGEALPHVLRVCPSCLSTPASVNKPHPQTWGLHGGAHYMGQGDKMKRILLLTMLTPLSPPLERGEMGMREYRGRLLGGVRKKET